MKCIVCGRKFERRAGTQHYCSACVKEKFRKRELRAAKREHARRRQIISEIRSDSNAF